MWWIELREAVEGKPPVLVNLDRVVAIRPSPDESGATELILAPLDYEDNDCSILVLEEYLEVKRRMQEARGRKEVPPCVE